MTASMEDIDNRQPSHRKCDGSWEILMNKLSRFGNEMTKANFVEKTPRMIQQIPEAYA